MVLDLSFMVHKVVGLLLGAYAEVDARDKQQRTPLHLCSETGHEAVVKVRNQLDAQPGCRHFEGCASCQVLPVVMNLLRSQSTKAVQ